MNRKFDFRVRWSEEDGEYVGTCEQFPSLSYLHLSELGALKGIRELAETEASTLGCVDAQVKEDSAPTMEAMLLEGNPTVDVDRRRLARIAANLLSHSIAISSLPPKQPVHLSLKVARRIYKILKAFGVDD